MQHGCIKPTCLTTNFDKLLEMAFAKQAVAEYMVRLMCAPPEENLKPNVCKARVAAGNASEETPLTVKWGSTNPVMFSWAHIPVH